MVTRLLRYETTFSGNETDLTMGEKSPGSGKQWEVQEVYGDQDSDLDYSLVYEERKLFDNIPAENLPDENNGIPFDLTVGSSEELTILGSENNGNTPNGVVVIRVDERPA